MFCSKCGRQLTEDMAFCIQCGTPVSQQHSAQHNHTNYTQSQLDPDVERLVGVKQEYYLPKFRQFKTLNKKTSWNWSAFLCTMWWFVYRKMYLYALCVWGINILVSAMTDGAGMLLVNIAAGVFGNYIYMNYLEEQASQAKMMMPAEKESFLNKKSGVNKGAVVALAAVFLLFVLIGALIFTALFATVVTNYHFYMG